MTARPEVDRLEDLLNELGWAYIEVGTGASDMQTSDDVERLTKEITDMFASLRGMREALDDMKYAAEKLNGAVDAMWNDPGGRIVSARHQADITHAQQVVKKTLDDHAAALSGIEPGDEQARSPSAHSAPASTLSKDTTK